MNELVLRFVEWFVAYTHIHFFPAVRIVVLAWVVHWLVRHMVGRLVHRKLRTHDEVSVRERLRREQTLMRVANTTSGVIILITAASLLIYELIGFNVLSLLTVAGVVGVVIAFGAQTIVRDVLAGVFLLLEDQYRIGDTVQFFDSGIVGTVEDITLRKTSVRDDFGFVHHIPHGSITRVTNRSRRFTRFVLDIPLPLAANISHARESIEKACAELTQNQEIASVLRGALQFMRVEDWRESVLVLRIHGECEPGEQARIAGMLRMRIKEAFDKDGILAC